LSDVSIERRFRLESYAVDGLIPKMVLAPEDLDDAIELVSVASREGLSITPRGSGTKLHIGAPPKRLDIVLLTEHLNEIVDYEPEDLTITVQAGVRLAELDKLLRKHGQMLPLEPPYYDLATVGGTVASNYNGPRRMGYGAIRDLVLGMKAVYSGGILAKNGGKVVKNTAGYDLKKLHIGGFGTLGLITEVSLRLYPIPEDDRSLYATFKSMKEVKRAIDRLNRSPLLPTAVEVLDKGVQGKLSSFSRVELPSADFAMLIRFEGLRVDTEREMMDSKDMLMGGKVEVLDGGEHERVWTGIREMQRIAEGCIVKLSYPPSLILEAFKTVREFAEGKVESYSHAGSGVQYVFVDEEELVKFVLRLRNEFDGREFYCVVERAPTDVKKEIDVWGYERKDLKLMRIVKKALDPMGLFNPGRFVGGI